MSITKMFNVRNRFFVDPDMSKKSSNRLSCDRQPSDVKAAIRRLLHRRRHPLVRDNSADLSSDALCLHIWRRIQSSQGKIEMRNSTFRAFTIDSRSAHTHESIRLLCGFIKKKRKASGGGETLSDTIIRPW
jgi:hypothetical protein